jgi:hypothetical protein
VRLVLVDPKQVELNHYEHVPHLLTAGRHLAALAANVLANLIGEMESRYGIMGEARCRNLAELNRARAKAGEAPLPHILCVIDELADLMMVSPAEVEDSIIRLAQKSRATGIHLVLATQRPSTDIITGTIKVNIPARIAFAVSSQTDSRVILDQGGAEALLGQGDMLFRGAGTSKLARVQGAFVTEEEIARITGHWAKQGEPEFEAELLEVHEEKGVEGGDDDFDPDADDLLDDAIRTVVQTETASVSMIQRRLRVGYTRAGRLIDMLERRGVISGYEGSKPRQVLITEADLSARAERRGRPVDVDDPVCHRVVVLSHGSVPKEPRGDSFTLGGATDTMSGWTAVSDPLCARRGIVASRPFRGRSRDQDPHPLPAGDGERGVGCPAGRRLHARLHPHLRLLSRPRRRAPCRRLPPQHRSAGRRAGAETGGAGGDGLPQRTPWSSGRSSPSRSRRLVACWLRSASRAATATPSEPARGRTPARCGGRPRPRPARCPKPGVELELAATGKSGSACSTPTGGAGRRADPRRGGRSRSVSLRGIRIGARQRLGDDARRQQAGRDRGKLQPASATRSAPTAT